MELHSCRDKYTERQTDYKGGRTPCQHGGSRENKRVIGAEAENRIESYHDWGNTGCLPGEPPAKKKKKSESPRKTSPGSAQVKAKLENPRPASRKRERREVIAFEFFKFRSEQGALDPGHRVYSEKCSGAGASEDWGRSSQWAMLTIETEMATELPRRACF